MKLGKLNAAIRAADAVRVRFSWGGVALQKGSLIEALRDHYGSKGAETMLTLTDDGFLTWELDHAG